MSEFIALGTPFLNVMAVICITTMASLWFIFEKANKPGWAILIPLYNAYVLQSVAKLKWWWFLVFLTVFIPFIGILTLLIWYFATCYRLSKCYGKNTWFALGLFFLFFVFYPILAFGKSEYMLHQNLD